MDINREMYLNQLITKKDNKLVKIITGVRRCGKSYLLYPLYYDYLVSIGIKDSQIIRLSLDTASNAKYRNPLALSHYLISQIVDNKKKYYIFLDEIQFVEEIKNPYVDNKKATITFVDVVLDLLKIRNVDIYITGSNSKMLSSDILSSFSNRGDEIKMNPLNFKEFSLFKKTEDCWYEYLQYGGLPEIVLKNSESEKSTRLKKLIEKTYLKDVILRHNINDKKEVMEDLINIIASTVGSLTNPQKLANTFNSEKNIKVYRYEIANFLDYLINAFLINKSYRYDISGRKFINTLIKYYFTDTGLRNAWLNFREFDEQHLMENVVYNELLIRGFNVDVGLVEAYSKDKNKTTVRKQYEVDFVANKGRKRYYIQVTMGIDTDEKRQQEINSLIRIKDSFKKIVIVKDSILPYNDNNGILYIGLKDFLLKENALDW